MNGVRCPKCGEIDASKFAKNSARSNGLQVYCKACHQDRQKADRARQGHRVYWNLKTRYGLTLEEYNLLLAKQDGVCAICEQPEIMKRSGKVIRLAVDHDHSCCPGKTSCGKCVRGLLCHNCNQILGRWKDGPLVLERAIFYLARKSVA